ncbi:MAG: DUF933 domain-containing protein, partial [Rickettsia endosymbiont of Ixodes persulcatus]|nr:DUF933 domain-containing protein [Rickettsia endosymbiont of Ixodes persulcatus]
HIIDIQGSSEKTLAFLKPVCSNLFSILDSTLKVACSLNLLFLILLKAKEVGKMRLEGKEYKMQDGDIVHYWFKIKNEIRKVTGQFKDISMAVEHVLKFI